MENGSTALKLIQRGTVRDYSTTLQFLLEVASNVGHEAEKFLETEQDDYQALIDSLLGIFKDTTESSTYKLGPKTAAFCMFCIYKLAPWGEESESSFREWCETVELSRREQSVAISLYREFRAWEPAIPSDCALLIMLDRAIVRSARVAATNLDPELFLNWLGRNKHLLRSGERIYERISAEAETIKSKEANEEAIENSNRSIQYIAQRVLLKVGSEYGRSGLNSVRRQVGAPPSRRRPSKECVGAHYSPRVYALSDTYVNLSVSEREALKELIRSVDKQ